MLALTACGSDPVPGDAIEDWDAHIAPMQRVWQTHTDKWNGQCSTVTVNVDAVCLDLLADMGLAATNIEMTISSTQNENGLHYLPGRPESIEEPLRETTKTAENAATAFHNLACPGEACETSAEAFIRHWGYLGDALALWPTP